MGAWAVVAQAQPGLGEAPAAPIPGLAPLSEVAVLDVPPVPLAMSSSTSGPGEPFVFALPFAVDVALAENGFWETTPDGQTAVWRLRVSSPSAVSLNFAFMRYRMPPGGRLRIFTADGEEMIGPFTDADNEEHGELWTPILRGDDAVIEVAVPVSRRDELELELGSVNRGFRDLGEVTSESHASCNIDVACSQADPYRDEVRSVGLMLFDGNGACTGVLLNNTAQDSKPYFLTARHCGFDASPEATARSVVVYWNYERPACGSGGRQRNQSQSGAYFRAGIAATDTALLELDDELAADRKLFLAGWDRSGSSITSAVTIHHPQHHYKSITSYSAPPIPTGYFVTDENPNGGLLHAPWSSGGGFIESVSSGGPMFDQNGRVVGQQLAVRRSPYSCDAGLAWSGRFAKAWNDGTGPGSRLRDWLDPGGSHGDTLDGMNPERDYPPRGLYPLDDKAVRSADGASGALWLDLAPFFWDDGGLSYAATSSDESAATVSVSDSYLSVVPVAEGTSWIDVTATETTGFNREAIQSFRVTVGDNRSPETAGTLAKQLLYESDTLSVDLLGVFSDADGDTLTYAASSTDELVVAVAIVDSTVTLTAAAQVNVLATATVDVTATDVAGSNTRARQRFLVNVESTPSVWGAHAAAPESGGSITFEATLSHAASREIAVDYMTVDGIGEAAALAGVHYTATSGVLTFAPGSTLQEVVVEITDNDLDEVDERTFGLTLSNPRNATLAGGRSTLEVPGVIEDDDYQPVNVSWVSGSFSLAEKRSRDLGLRLDRTPGRIVELFVVPTYLHGADASDFVFGTPCRPDPAVPGVAQCGFLFRFQSDVRESWTNLEIRDDESDDDCELLELRIVRRSPGVFGGDVLRIGAIDDDGVAVDCGGPPDWPVPVPGEPGEPGGGSSGGGGGGGSSPPEEDEDEEDDDPPPPPPPPPSRPPAAAFTVEGATCDVELCRAVTGEALRFADTSSGTVRSRRWDFGDGSTSGSGAPEHVWSSPGFYEVTLEVSDGTSPSTARRVFLIAAAEPKGTCAADAGTLCLQDSRYAVAVEWRQSDGENGTGRVVHRGTNDSGLFTFFGRENWEVQIKLLDGCAVNGHVWVYGASTTDLGYLIRVTDTATGEAKEYRNEPGSPAAAITDAAAFPDGCRPPPGAP